MLRVGFALALLLAAAVLAGCSSPKVVDEVPDEGPRLKATSTTGVVRGVVVDEAIRPLEGVDLVLRGASGERTTTSDADGFFGFESVPPGDYFVAATRLGYTDVQRDVRVEAGVDDPPVVKLQMVFVPGEAPFSTAVRVEAFIQCIVPGANVCAIVNLYPCAVAGLCDPLLEDTSHVVIYDSLVALARTPDLYQAELVWKSTQSVSPELGVRISAYSPDDGAGIDARQTSAAGGSPLTMPLDRLTMEEWETGTVEGVSYEIFGHTSALSAIGSAGFVLNQQVTFYVHTFYGYLPPEGWTFYESGEVPSP